MRQYLRLLLSLVVVCALASLIHPIGAEDSVQVDGQRATEEKKEEENDVPSPLAAPTTMRVLNKKLVQFSPKTVVVDGDDMPPPPAMEEKEQAAVAEDHARMQKAAEEELARKKHQQQIIEEQQAAAIREQEAIEQRHRQEEEKKETIQQEPFVEEDHELADTNIDSSASHQDHKRTLWGGAHKSHDEEEKVHKSHHDEQEERQQNDAPPSLQPQPQQKGIPFIPKHPVSSSSTSTSGLPTSSTGGSLHSPPKGYVITARVYIDPVDKLAHLDQNHITLPYWDCGVTGSTTSPLAIKEATFRHSLSPSTPSSWSGTDGKHALLTVALSPLILEVSSGESLTIQPGQVVLLEDVLVPGHKFKPINHLQDLQVLFLTLPQPHYHTGKEHVSLHASSAKSKAEHPCPIKESGDELMGVTTLSSSKGSVVSFFHGKRVRRWMFGLVGMSLSTLVADFLGKTAPLWLAAGIGGTCFVVAGTALSVFLGETSWINLEAWYQQRRLRPTRSSSSQRATETREKHQQQEEWQQQQQQQQQQQAQPIKTAFQPRHEEIVDEEET